MDGAKNFKASFSCFTDIDLSLFQQTYLFVHLFTQTVMGSEENHPWKEFQAKFKKMIRSHLVQFLESQQ